MVVVRCVRDGLKGTHEERTQCEMCLVQRLAAPGVEYGPELPEHGPSLNLADSQLMGCVLPNVFGTTLAQLGDHCAPIYSMPSSPLPSAGQANRLGCLKQMHGKARGWKARSPDTEGSKPKSLRNRAYGTGLGDKRVMPRRLIRPLPHGAKMQIRCRNKYCSFDLARATPESSAPPDNGPAAVNLGLEMSPPPCKQGETKLLSDIPI